MSVSRTNWFSRYGIGVVLIVGAVVVTGAVVRRWHRPGQLDVLTAQAMDMSEMRPPTGAAPVELAVVRRGGLGGTVTYTGSVEAFNTQEISPRIVGQLIALPVYPGDSVRAGQLLAQLDTVEIGAKTAQADAEASAAEVNQQMALLTHHLHHHAALDQAAAQVDAASEGVTDAQAEAQAADAAVNDARAAVQSAGASADYWKTEIAREKSLADAGAASRQEYQSELSQAQAADAGLAQAQAKLLEARSMAVADSAKIREAERQVDSARAMQRMAGADLALAQQQEKQAEFGAVASRAAASQAATEQGYARITSPVDGVITERAVAPGTMVQPGTVLLRVAEIDRVRVQAHVAVTDLVGVRRGTVVRIVPQSGARGGMEAIAATVSSVFPAANEMSRTAVVEAIVDNPHHDLLPGAFVTMRLTTSGARDGLLIPAGAIVYDGGKAFVWMAGHGGASDAPVVQYECAICHMRYSAADAKKNHYRDPMDGGKLMPVIPAGENETVKVDTGGVTVKRVPVMVMSSDGRSTEVSASGLSAGDRVVVRGQAGLVDGGPVVPTAWGDNGPETLPSAAKTMGGVTRYRCEKCGMTYSEEDAKKNGFIDPMDGGKLMPVREGNP